MNVILTEFQFENYSIWFYFDSTEINIYQTRNHMRLRNCPWNFNLLCTYEIAKSDA